MQGLEWGRLYERCHSKSYDPTKVSAEVKRLYGDPYIKNRRGIFEYVLGGSQDAKLLDIRVFDEATKRSVFATQTAAATAAGKSNCPHCAVGHDANKSRMWTLTEMEADHVGFVCPDHFVVGYGMDVAYAFRELPFVGVVTGDA